MYKSYFGLFPSCITLWWFVFSWLVNSGGVEELTNGGGTREKLSLLFSLFPPSMSSVRGYRYFGDSCLVAAAWASTIRVGLRPFDVANWLRGGKKHPPAFGYSFEFSTEMTLLVLFSCLFWIFYCIEKVTNFREGKLLSSVLEKVSVRM